MKRYLLQWICFILTLALCVGVFTACSKEQSGEEEKKESPTNVVSEESSSNIGTIKKPVVIRPGKEAPYTIGPNSMGQTLVILVPNGSDTAMQVAENTTVAAFLTCVQAKSGYTLVLRDGTNAQVTDVNQIIADGFCFEVVNNQTASVCVSMPILVVKQETITSNVEQQEDIDKHNSQVQSSKPVSSAPASSKPASSSSSKPVSSTPASSQPQDKNKASISLSVKEKTMERGDTFTLIASLSVKGETVSWSSSDSSVVAVSDGLLMAKALGNAVITAKLVYENAVYEATCKVTVQSPKGLTAFFSKQNGTVSKANQSPVFNGKTNATVYAYYGVYNETDGNLISSGSQYTVTFMVTDPTGKVLTTEQIKSVNGFCFGFTPQVKGKYSVKAIMTGDITGIAIASYTVS